MTINTLTAYFAYAYLFPGQFNIYQAIACIGLFTLYCAALSLTDSRQSFRLDSWELVSWVDVLRLCDSGATVLVVECCSRPTLSHDLKLGKTTGRI